MRAEIDYYFSLMSPWSFMGLGRLREFAQRTGSTITYKPVSTAAVFAAHGGKPLAERPAARRAYRLVELERWRAYLDLRINLEPAHFPVDERRAAHTVVAAVLSGADVGDLCERLHQGVWVNEENIADPDVIANALIETGHDPSLLDAGDGQDAIMAYEANTVEAIDRGVFGVPTYVVEGEMFWGQDRLGFVARKLGLRELGA